MRAPWLWMLVLAALVGCGDPTRPQHESLFAVTAGHGVLLENRSDTPVVFIIMETEFAARANFTLCERPVSDPADCGAIPAHGWGRVPNANIGGYHPGARAIVYHARLVKDSQSGNFVRDSVRTLIVALR